MALLKSCPWNHSSVFISIPFYISICWCNPSSGWNYKIICNFPDHLGLIFISNNIFRNACGVPLLGLAKSIFIYSIVAQVIIEILALSLAENGIIFCYNQIWWGDNSGKTIFQNGCLAPRLNLLMCRKRKLKNWEDNMYFVHPSTDSPSMYRPIYRPTLDQYVGRHIYRRLIDRYIGRGIGRVSVDILSNYRPI